MNTSVLDPLTATIYGSSLGSGHFPNSDYRCKGGGYQTEAGADIGFCCSVVEGDNPLCIIATPNQ